MTNSAFNRRAVLAALLAAPLLFGAGPASQAGEVYASDGVAIRGYDPVAYFKDKKPVQGSEEFSFEHAGVKWHFSSAENRDAFKESPETYAPQFGGYCAYAVSRGYTAKIEPEAWKVVDGKLYLNYSLNVRELWSKDIPGNIEKGEGNWPKLKEGLAKE